MISKDYCLRDVASAGEDALDLLTLDVDASVLPFHKDQRREHNPITPSGAGRASHFGAEMPILQHDAGLEAFRGQTKPHHTSRTRNIKHVFIPLVRGSLPALRAARLRVPGLVFASVDSHCQRTRFRHRAHVPQENPRNGLQPPCHLHNLQPCARHEAQLGLAAPAVSLAHCPSQVIARQWPSLLGGYVRHL